MWAKPRKVNEVPFVSGWLVPPGRLLRKSTKRVLSGWSDSPYRAKRLPKTSRTRLASRKFSNAITDDQPSAHSGDRIWNVALGSQRRRRGVGDRRERQVLRTAWRGRVPGGGWSSPREAKHP